MPTDDITSFDPEAALTIAQLERAHADGSLAAAVHSFADGSQVTAFAIDAEPLAIPGGPTPPSATEPGPIIALPGDLSTTN